MANASLRQTAIWGKERGQVAHDNALPIRVQVEVELIDQHHAFGLPRRLPRQVGIQLNATQRDVRGERRHAPLSVAEQRERKTLTLLEVERDVVEVEVVQGPLRALDAAYYR